MNPDLAEHLLALPSRVDSLPWSSNVQSAYQKVSSAYERAYHLLHESDPLADPLRLSMHVEQLVREIHPILLALASVVDVEHLPQRWLKTTVESMAQLAEMLQKAYQNAHGRQV